MRLDLLCSNGPKRSADVAVTVYKIGETEYSEAELRDLKELDLRRHAIDLAKLVTFHRNAAPHLRGLERLNIASVNFDAAAVEYFGRNVAPLLESLTDLKITIEPTRDGGASARAFATVAAPNLRRLTNLIILPPYDREVLERSVESLPQEEQYRIFREAYTPSEEVMAAIENAVEKHLFGLKTMDGNYHDYKKMKTLFERNEMMAKWSRSFFSGLWEARYRGTEADFRQEVARHRVWGDRGSNSRQLTEVVAMRMPYVSRERMREFRAMYDKFPAINEEVKRSYPDRPARELDDPVYREFLDGVLNKFRFA